MSEHQDFLKYAHIMDKYGKYKSADVFESYAYRLSRVDRNVTAKIHSFDEYWLDAMGNATYANGDYGDYDHKMLAEQAILSDLGYDGEAESLSDAHEIFNQQLDSAKEWAPDDGSELGEYFDMLMNKYGESQWKTHAELSGFLFWKTHGHITNPDELQKSQEEFDEVWHGLSHNPRLHAIQHKQWYRLAHKEIETWTLTVDDAQNIARSLWNAFDEDAENETYNIEVKSSGEYLTDVTFEELENGTVVYRLKNRPAQVEPTPMQQTLDSVDLMNQLSKSAPVSEGQYQNYLQTAYPDNEKIQELYRYQGASRRI